MLQVRHQYTIIDDEYQASFRSAGAYQFALLLVTGGKGYAAMAVAPTAAQDSQLQPFNYFSI